MWVAELIDSDGVEIDRNEETCLRLLTYAMEFEWAHKILVASKYEKWLSIDIYYVQD